MESKNMRFVYVASSWRNPFYTDVIKALRARDIPHYDFRHDGAAFDWADVDPTWKSQDIHRNTYTAQQMQDLFTHPAAERGFAADDAALSEAYAVLMVLPCGRSAHLELGYAIGKHKETCILQPLAEEPELMYALADEHVATIEHAVWWCIERMVLAH